MSETIERLRAEVERAGGGHRGYLLAAEKAVVERVALRAEVVRLRANGTIASLAVAIARAERAEAERDALQRRVDVAWLTARDWRIRAETAEAERDALATNVRMAGRSAEHAKAERDALRAKCGDLGASVNIMGKVAVNLGQAKQIAESTLVELQRDDDHDQALLIEALSRLEDERDALRDSYDAAAAAWGRDEQEYLQEVERLRGLLTEWIPRHSAACCTPTPEIGTFPPGPFLPKWCCCDDLSKRSRSALEEKP